MKTIALEQLPSETRQVVESWLSAETPVIILRDGIACGDVTPYESFDELTPKEEEELMEEFRQGDEDFAAGKYITLDEFKVKYADKLSGKVK